MTTYETAVAMLHHTADLTLEEADSILRPFAERIGAD